MNYEFRIKKKLTRHSALCTLNSRGFTLVALMVAFIVVFSAVAIIRVTTLPLGGGSTQQAEQPSGEQNVSFEDQDLPEGVEASKQSLDESIELADISKEEGEGFSFIE